MFTAAAVDKKENVRHLRDDMANEHDGNTARLKKKKIVRAVTFTFSPSVNTVSGLRFSYYDEYWSAYEFRSNYQLISYNVNMWYP